MSAARIGLRDGHFVDAAGRVVLLRGVNLGGDSKVPFPDGGTDRPTDFSDHRSVSFVGRPFPLEEADEHLARIRRWGFNCLRLLTTWEAVEHAGPGEYDSDYLDYFAEVCRRAERYGLFVFVDFHQDVWSRMTGGDGAPGWTLEAAGLDIATLDRADAALVMQRRYDYGDPRPHQPERYPPMCWSQNYFYPANGILWTLFFAGRDFAPDLLVDGKNVQDFLQERFLGAQREVASRLQALPNVIGFGALNEPSGGWIGRSLSARPAVDRKDRPRRPGFAWSPLLCLAAASGNPVELDEYAISWLHRGCVPVRRAVANPLGLSIWRAGAMDPFASAWELNHDDTPRALREDYFQRVGDRRVDFEQDYLRPFLIRVAENVRRVRSDWLLFAEKDPDAVLADARLPGPLPAGTVNANHWYDIFTLMTRTYTAPVAFDIEKRRPVVGRRAVERLYTGQLARLRDASRALHPDCATLVGEFGIPFDLNGARAYRAHRAGARGARPWRQHVEALDLAYNALDRLGLSATIWNYTASNRNDPRTGDGWNQEDLSIFSRDQQTGDGAVDDGGRALSGWVRPFARRIQGRLESMRFERGKGRFTLCFEAEPSLQAPTEIFVPRLQFPDGFHIEAPGLEVEQRLEKQLILLHASSPGPHKLVLRRR